MAGGRPFRFIANLPTTTRPVDAWKEQVRRIEAVGFTTVAIADHFTDGYTLEPLVALTAAAMCTTTLRVQTAVLGNDYRHPVMVHRGAATLDVLSGGRLELGIGAGWLAPEYEAAGLRFDRPGRRIDRLEETIAILKGLFRGEPFSFTGETYRVTDLVGVPTSVQRPHPPLMIGGGGPRVLHLAGREADIVGINANLGAGIGARSIVDVSSEGILEKVGWAHEGAVAAGRSPGDLELSMAQWLLHVTPSKGEAGAVLERVGARTGLDPQWLEAAPGVLVGSVVRCVEKLHELRDHFGISYVQVDAGPRSTDAIEAVAPVVAALAG
jgi:probable F420-dependent oxidoreductase